MRSCGARGRGGTIVVSNSFHYARSTVQFLVKTSNNGQEWQCPGQREMKQAFLFVRYADADAVEVSCFGSVGGTNGLVAVSPILGTDRGGYWPSQQERTHGTYFPHSRHSPRFYGS